MNCNIHTLKVFKMYILSIQKGFFWVDLSNRTLNVPKTYIIRVFVEAIVMCLI